MNQHGNDLRPPSPKPKGGSHDPHSPLASAPAPHHPQQLAEVRVQAAADGCGEVQETRANPCLGVAASVLGLLRFSEEEPQPGAAERKMSKYRIFIDTSDYDLERFPIPTVRIEPNPSECRHTPTPDGYNQWEQWAQDATKAGFRQVTCPHCGRWEIWLPKDEAKKINDLKKKQEREMARALKGKKRATY